MNLAGADHKLPDDTETAFCSTANGFSRVDESPTRQANN